MSTTSDGFSENEMEWMISRSTRQKRAARERNRKERELNWSDGSEVEPTKRKKSRHSPQKQDQHGQTNDWKVVIEFNQDGGHYHPIKLTKAIEDEIGKIKFAKFMKNKRVMIHANSKQQQEKILGMSTLLGERMKAHVPGDLASVRGVISGIPLSMTMEDIKKEIKGGKVIKASRIKNKRDGVLKDTTAVILQFEKVLPRSVQMGYINFNVREYIPKPLRCFACQRMGHIAKQCNGKLRCARCGGQHEYGKCEKDAKVKCCNCGGDHSAAYEGCVVQKEAREAQRVKITEKVSYAEALKKVRVEGTHQVIVSEQAQRKVLQDKAHTRESQVQNPVQSVCSHKCKTGENTIAINKIQFVAFICHTVNVATQMTRKSDKIKTIVEAAGKFLEMKDLKADQIHALLSTDESVGNVQTVS